MPLEFEKEIVGLEDQIAQMERKGPADKAGASRLSALRRERDARIGEIYANLTPWQTVQVARHEDRPLLRDYIETVFEDFVELHGDRRFGDDRAMIGGFARLENHRIMLIGHQKGRSVEENVEFNFGMARPEGYRKALRMMKLAEKWGLPVVCLIDTPGAHPGIEAETRGQAEAIALNLTEMPVLETPIITVVTGEGGSGGALGIGVGDVNLMLAYSVYSVISPEGCASILWRNAEKSPEAAEALKLTANALLEMGVIDGVVTEPAGGAHRHRDEVMGNVKAELLNQLPRLKKISPKRLVKRRMEKYAKIGKFS
jgi:acetyl-CoA carboxylase carboxyl transferase subunit alpha